LKTIYTIEKVLHVPMRLADGTPLFGDHTDMRGDDTPAFGEPRPGLHLATDLAGYRRTVKQR
jgi:hypothetical protein